MNYRQQNNLNKDLKLNIQPKRYANSYDSFQGSNH